ncbi:MAG: hypothetical protein R2690_08025 [Acidimicrobiales bacterium]
MAKLLAQPERTPLDGVWTTPGPSSTTAYQPLRWWTTAWRTALWGAALVSLALTTLLAFVAAVGVDSSGVLPFDPDLASLGGIATLGLQVFSLGVVAVLLVAVGWTNRAYRNLEALGTGPSRIAGPGGGGVVRPVRQPRRAGDGAARHLAAATHDCRSARTPGARRR